MKKLPLLGLLFATVANAQPNQPQPTGEQPIPTTQGSGPGLGQPTPPPPATNTPPQGPPPIAPTPSAQCAAGSTNVPTSTPRASTPSSSPLQLDQKDLDELKAVESDYDQFIDAGKQHDTRMRQIARTEYNSRTSDLEKKYAERTAKAETAKPKLYGDTQARLEKFVADHPNHEQFTPDAMFRLADVYLHLAEDEVDRKLAELDANPSAANNPDSAAIVADYSKSLALWEDILKRFPKYRQTPSTMYLLAYYGKTKDDRVSLQRFLALTCSNHYKWDDPPTKAPTKEEAIKRVEQKSLREVYADCQAYPGADLELVRHAWVRGVADYHFTVPGEIDDAIAAYLKVANGGQDSKLYAESLYKLAWSYYKRDYLKDSIERFDESVKLYDATVAAGNTPPLDLRDESIQYIAVAFTDPWNGETDTDPAKAFQRAQDFYKGRENEPHVRDVWVAMGQAFEDLQAWDQAVDAYRIAIGPPWELNPKNPVIHQKIVNVFEEKGDKFAADAAAADLATKYAPCTAWYAANEKDREAMENQRHIAERALYAAARNTHSAATTMRKDWEAGGKKDAQMRTDYLAMYAKAVELYRQFVETYPESDYVYEFTFLQGEALFYSEHYPEAIAQYKWVRDHRDLGTAYYLDASRSVLASYQAEVDQQVAAGTIQPLKIPSVEDLKAKQPWTPQPIPQIYQDLRNEYDVYQNIVQDPAAAPGQGINAALISLAYFHVDDAIARFQKVMDKFCSVGPAKPGELAPAAKAKDGILAIYEAQANYDAIEATNKRFINAKCGDENSIQLAISQNRSLNFTRATDLFAKAKASQDPNEQVRLYGQAAEAFYRFYKTAPPNDSDLPTALYNTAVSYKLANKPKTAIALFKEFTSRPEKAFRESAYYLDAMRLTADSQLAAFEYDQAITSYLALYDTTTKAKKLGIKPPPPIGDAKPMTLEEIGLQARFNAAYSANVSRDFKRAVDLYGAYMKIEPDREKQADAQWAIANIYKQSGDVLNMVQAFDKWRSKYGKDAGHEDDYVRTYSETAELYRRKGNTKAAKAAEQQAIDAWNARGAKKNSEGAKIAAQYALSDAEEFYQKTWTPFEITKPASSTVLNTAKAQIVAQQKQIQDLRTKTEDKFRELDKYGVAEVTMAATVRYGDIQYDRAQKLSNIPIPKIIANNAGAVEAFENQRDAQLKASLDEAKTNWQKVAELAKQNGISNKWSQKALENLAREFPDEYKALRQELVQGTDAP